MKDERCALPEPLLERRTCVWLRTGLTVGNIVSGALAPVLAMTRGFSIPWHSRVIFSGAGQDPKGQVV
jgi:hypothetical protein